MNYIKQLQAEVKQLTSDRDDLRSGIKEFIGFVANSGKFNGTDLDGSRKDWIATHDTIQRLQNILYGN